MKYLKFIIAVWMVMLTASRGYGAIVGDQIDTFTAAGLAGWSGNSSRTRLTTGGPNGVGDAFMRVGNPSGGFVHFGVRNQSSQWTGNYITAGVVGIEMNIKNISITGLTGEHNLTMRIMLFGAGGTWAYTSLTPISHSWHRYKWFFDEANFTYVPGGEELPGTGIFADTLGSLETILIRHDWLVPTPPGGPHPPHVGGFAGFDNIHAMVPEPGSVGLLGLGAMGLMRRRR